MENVGLRRILQVCDGMRENSGDGNLMVHVAYLAGLCGGILGESGVDVGSLVGGSGSLAGAAFGACAGSAGRGGRVERRGSLGSCGSVASGARGGISGDGGTLSFGRSDLGEFVVGGETTVRGDSEVVSCHGDAGGGGGATAAVGSVVQPGVHARRNKRKRELRKVRDRGWDRQEKCSRVQGVSSGGSGCVSPSNTSCSGVSSALRSSFDARRVAENRLVERKAVLALDRLSDESSVAAYDDMRKKVILQRANSAVARSEKSLASVESISPGSSMSQFEIRQQAKRLGDVEGKLAGLRVVLERKYGVSEADALYSACIGATSSCMEEIRQDFDYWSHSDERV